MEKMLETAFRKKGSAALLAIFYLQFIIANSKHICDPVLITLIKPFIYTLCHFTWPDSRLSY